MPLNLLHRFTDTNDPVIRHSEHFITCRRDVSSLAEIMMTRVVRSA